MMSLTAFGIVLIVVGMAILISVPFITAQIGVGSVADVSGLTCVVIFFIPLCFSVGMHPTVTAVFALMILIVFGILTYIAFRVYRSVSGYSRV